MDAATSLVTISALPSFIYYGSVVLSVIAAVFLAGWFFNTKLKGLCSDSISNVKDELTKAVARIQKLEDEAIRTTDHQKDITMIVGLITQLQKDFKDGFTEVSRRIDTLLLNTVK